MAIKFLSNLKIGNITFPTQDGAAGQVLATDGAGNLSFVNAATVDKYINGLSFSGGTLTASVAGGSNVSVSLDGRYALTSHNHAGVYDNYQSWNLKTNGVQRTTVQSGGTLDLVAGSNVSLSYSAGGVVTISSTDTNTNYYVTSASFNTTSGILTLTRNDGGTVGVDLDGKYSELGHTHDDRYYTESESDARFVALVGSTMTGNINWATNDRGITWGMNTDGAYIKFFNTGDGDTNSRLEYSTSDNGDEFHRWLISSVEEMTLKSDGLRVTDSIWMGGRLVATQDWVTSQSYAASSHTHSNATTSAAGFMSAADKSKLDGIAAGATANTGTVTSVSGTGSYGGLTLSGTVTSSGSLTLGGTPSGTWPISVSGNASTASSTTVVGVHAGNEVNLGGGYTGGGTLYVNYNDGGSYTNMSFYNGGTSLCQLTASQFNGALSGNATTATTLQTARTINGTSFNGSANITTANWGTGRTITIGSTGKTVDGSGNVSWSLAEIGAQVAGSYAAASHTHDDRYLPYSASSEYSNLPAGWYTIAVNAGNRASGKFILRDTSSGNHQSTVFYATHHYGSYSDITVLINSRYSGNPFRYLRIKDGGTYDGAMLQVYLDQGSNTVTTWLLENIQANGWIVKNWIADGTNPGDVSNFAALTEVPAQVDLDYAPQGGMITTGDIYGGGDTTQYLHLNTNNYNSYAPTLTGGNASGTWGINITGNAATATTLQTARAINGTAFNGSADITTANWGTARTITIGNTGKSVNGSANVSWTLAEIGAYAATNPNGYTSNTGTVTSVSGTGGYGGLTLSGTVTGSGSLTLGGTPSGTWPISITGSSGSVSGLTLNNSGSPINPDNVTQNQIGYNTNVSLFGQTDGGLYSSAYGSSWIHQIYGDFRTGQIAIRGKNNGTWQSWRTVLDSSNFTSYAAASSHTHTPSQVGLGNVTNDTQVTVGYNSTLNSDTRNKRGVTRLFRRDEDSDYSVQTYWTGSYWRLYGYNGDSGHADTHVGYSDSSGYASSAGNADTVDGWHRDDIRAWGNITGKPSSIFTYDGWVSAPGYDANTIAGNKSGFTYANNAPYNGPLAHFESGGYGLQLNAPYSGTLKLSFRTRNGDSGTWNGWIEAITSNNIGSQSVNYASSAGSVAWGNVSSKPSNLTYWDTWYGSAYLGSNGDLYMGWAGVWTSSWFNQGVRTDSAPTFRDVYTSGWFRNYGLHGLYNEDYGNHWYARSDSYWTLAGNNGSAVGIQLRTGGFEGSLRGYVYANSSNEIGFLNTSGSWSLRCDNSGNVTATADLIAYSDARLKENIETIDNALQKVVSLRGVSYNRIDTEDKSTKLGLVAQEVKAVLPEVVYEQEDGILGVSYGNIVGVLIEAMKEQQAMIETLEAKIELLTKFLK